MVLWACYQQHSGPGGDSNRNPREISHSTRGVKPTNDQMSDLKSHTSPRDKPEGSEGSQKIVPNDLMSFI